MIPHRIDRKPGNDNYRALALYAADAKINGNTGEKTLMSWHEGCMAEDYLSAMIEVEATQAMNTRTGLEKTYHLMVSFRPEDEAKLTPEIFKDIEKKLAKSIGFSNHQRHCGVHKNTDNIHMHIAYNMIDPDKFNRHAPFYDYPKLHKVCRELEVKYGLKIDKGMDDFKDKTSTKKHVKAATIEAQTGQQSFFNFVASQREIITKAVESSANWKEFHEALLKRGMEVKPRGNGLVIQDRFGKHAVKASDIDRSLAKSKLEKVFGSFISATEEQQKNIQTEVKYMAEPLQKNAQKDALYAQFQIEMEQRKAVLEAVKEQEGKAFHSNKNKWAEKRKKIINVAMLPADRQRVLQEIKAREEAESAANRLALEEKRKAIRDSIPYTSWTKFLQHHAALGNESALNLLRSKKVQPELASTNSNEKSQKELEVKKELKEKQIAILRAQGINQKHKRALIAVLKMQELISNETGMKNEEIKHRIDTKGTVIFTLKTGGTIRDTGAEIHFSAHDENIRKLAQKFGSLQWGQQMIIENNTIKMPQKARKRGTSR